MPDNLKFRRIPCIVQDASVAESTATRNIEAGSGSFTVNPRAVTKTNLKHWRRDLLLGYLS